MAELLPVPSHRDRLPETEAHLTDYVRIVMRRIWVVVLFFVTVVGVVAIGTFKATPVYKATARLVIERPTSSRLPLQEALSGLSVLETEKFYRTQYGLLESPRILRELKAIFDFGSMPEYAGLSDEDLVKELAANIEVEPQEQSFLVDVSFLGRDPETITTVLNQLVQIYIDHNNQAAERSIETGERFVAEKLPELKDRLAESFRELTDFQTAHNVISDEENKEILRSEIRSLSESVAKIQSDLEMMRSRKTVIEEAKAREDGLEIQFRMLGDSAAEEWIARAKEEKRKLEQDLAAVLLKASYVKSEVEGLRAQLAVKNTAIDEQMRLSLANFDNELRRTEILLESRRAAEDDLLSKTQVIYRTLAEFRRLQDAYKLNYDLLDTFTKRHNELVVSRNVSTEGIRVECPAIVPERPVRPRKALNLLLASLVGLFGGIGLAFFFDYLDDTIKGRDDIARYLGAPAIGYIPSMPSGRRGECPERDLVTHLNPKSSISEAYRSVRTGLAFSRPEDERTVILVTSACPREGKTTTAINIAIAIAQSGRRVLIADTDLRRPRVHKTFGLDNSRGVTTLFLKDVALEEVIQPTEIENLWVLPSGPIPPNPSELLGSPRMRAILEALKGRFDRIVLDSPPTVAVTDASVLGKLADTTLMVVNAHGTRKKVAAQGRENLATVGVPLTGVILNNMRAGRHGYYYYGGYSTYGYYGSDDGALDADEDE